MKRTTFPICLLLALETGDDKWIDKRVLLAIAGLLDSPVRSHFYKIIYFIMMTDTDGISTFSFKKIL